MKTILRPFLILIAALFLLWPAKAFAHQPRIVGGPAGNAVIVDEPEVSKAYYDELPGSPRVYRVTSAGELPLYINLLVPASTNPEGRYSAALYSVDGTARELIERLEGGATTWQKYYEPFAGDYYFKGPELRRTLEPGTFEIEVTAPGNTGKYALAVGEEESFSPSEIISAFTALPKLKTWFFNRWPGTLTLSILGPMFIVALLVIGMLLSLIARVLFHFFREAAPVRVYMSFRSNRRASWLVIGTVLLILGTVAWSPALIVIAGYSYIAPVRKYKPYQKEPRSRYY